MQSAQPVANPFALLLNPAAVVEEMERSERLNRLASRICRPLDRAQPPAGGSTDVAADDADLVLAPDESSSRIG
jgi:hypothetical protein